MRYAGYFETHLDSRQRAGEHQIIKVPEVADAEHLARKPSQARAERHIKLLQNERAESRFIESLGHENRSHRIAVFARIERADLETPRAYCAARRFRVPGVALENVLEPLLFQQRQRFF